MFLEEERSTTLPLSFDPVYYEKMRQVHEQNLQQWRVRQTGDTYVCHLSAKDGDRRLTCVKEWAINEGAQFARLPSPPQAGPSTVTESMQETGEGRGGTRMSRVATRFTCHVFRELGACVAKRPKLVPSYHQAAPHRVHTN